MRNWKALFAVAVVSIALHGFSAAARADTATADRAWSQMLQGGERPVRQVGEPSLAYFMRRLEVSRIRQRDLGKAFWKRFPGDERRYQWLMMTVHLPPRYARDIREWSTAEARLGPNTAFIDGKALQRWEKEYAGMRREFWEDTRTDDFDRRFLWFGELRQQLLRLEEAAARGETVDPRPVLQQIVEYTRRFPRWFDAADESEYQRYLQGLLSPVFGRGTSIGVDAKLQLSFAQQLQAVDSEYLGMVSRPVIQRLGEGKSAWAPPVLSGPWSQLPQYPGEAPTRYAGHVVFFHDREAGMRKTRELGLQLWQYNDDPDSARRWLIEVLTMGLTYALDVIGTAHLYAREVSIATPMGNYPIDEEALAGWRAGYSALRHTLQTDKRFIRHLGSLRRAEMIERLQTAQQQWRSGDKEIVDVMLEEVHQLLASEVDAATAEYALREIFNYDLFDLTDGQLRALIEPALTSGRESLRRFAEAKMRLLDLRRHPVELAGPTLHGGHLDIQTLRGKYVLLDFWSTGCAACIRAMPRIHKTYRRYRERGFEVVSICYDAAKERSKVERVEQDLGLTWPTIVADDFYERDIRARYGWAGVPQYLLLDREGKVIAGTQDIDSGRNLEALLDRVMHQERPSHP